ncbi:cytochrome c oxidase assembly protein [Curtobacterium caseinilyticum]|uniref:Cytochrome c oxidase assembly protein n=1 Tax=Curtobacterium caseinilyticum TaxID=3055137 RepID=A0ABT7TQR3_9MICO|nr:cytochrome c oxidase assembly protein [Curtobacterium caseinilyticum]MDM7891933.1 cytochrome c oxidase assembly protein [Curtobacterium caseinilyticum]
MSHPRGRTPRPSRRRHPTPEPAEFWSTWHVDPLAAVLLVVAAGTYGSWLVGARRRRARWSGWRTLSFVLALALFTVLQFGIVGQYDQELRWAFTLRLALLFFAVPTFAALAAPVSLLRAGGPVRWSEVADRVMGSRPVRVLGNAIVAPVVGLVLFAVLLTPLSATMRESGVWASAITVLVPVLGFTLLAPLSEPGVLRSSTFVTVEFLLAFVELLLDAVPGIVLRVTNHVLDGSLAHAGALVHAVSQPWFPSPLRDQHLAGDLLWFIAEIADVPVLVMLFVRWQRTDRREARSVDALSDEEMAELTRAHLQRRG